MPVYLYRCSQCGQELEARQRFSEAPLVECPRCRGRLRRVINKVGVVFRGSGFYVNDSRNGKANGKANGAPAKEKGPEKAVGGEEPGSNTNSAKESTPKPAVGDSTS
ncbi:MAG: FmdB family zinc ribbon protein [Candidatus Promineifilaceae bacterium]